MDFPLGEFSYECLHCDTRGAANSRLCIAHQIWNLDEHVFTCQNQPRLDLHRYFAPSADGSEAPLTFTTESEREFANAHHDLYIHTLEDLLAAEPAFIKGSDHCIICRQVSSAYEGLDIPLDIAQIAMFRPFAASPLRYEKEENGISQTGPYTIRCILPVILCQQPASHNLNRVGASNADHIYNYRMIYLPLELRYDISGDGLLDARPWDRSFIDLDFVSSWLSTCKKNHGEECNSTSQSTTLPAGHRMIDTVKRCVVAEPDDLDDFIALSYMWSSATGGRDIQLLRSNQKDLHRPGALQPSLLPHVIEDSITMCRNLGYRYLWVDRLCIIQDDAQSKHSQIQAMDAIYSLAVLTFVALTDGKTHVGLPGSPNRPRLQNFSTESHEWKLERFLKSHIAVPPASFVDHSAWRSRGWTFQERLLSKRRLYISGHQVLLCCGTLTSSANAPLSLEEIELQMDHGMSGVGGGRSEPSAHQIDRFSTFRRTVEDYSQTVLSFQSDIINAITGVTNIVCRTLNTRFSYGHPERFFLQSLLWAPTSPDSKCRIDISIPSWSWAGWTGPIQYNRVARELFTFPQGVGTLVKFHIVDTNTGANLRRVETNDHWFSLSTDGPGTEIPFVLPQMVGNWEEDMKRQWGAGRPNCVQVWKECPHNPTEASKQVEIPLEIMQRVMARGSAFDGALVFRTTRAYLSLTRSPSAESFEVRTNGATGRVEKQNVETLTICDQEGSTIGHTMLMQAQWNAEHIDLDKKLHEFIVLGAGMDLLKTKDTWSFAEKYTDWGLFVMLVQKVEDEEDTSCRRRVAVGILAAEAWKDVGAEWTTVILK